MEVAPRYTLLTPFRTLLEWAVELLSKMFRDWMSETPYRLL